MSSATPRGMSTAVQHLVGTARRLPVPREEGLERQHAGPCGRRQLRPRRRGTTAGGTTVGGRRRIAQVASDRAGVLHLDRPDLDRRGAERVEPRGQRGAGDVGPTGERADPIGIRGLVDASELRRSHRCRSPAPAGARHVAGTGRLPPASTTRSATKHPHRGVDIGWNQVLHEHRPSAELTEC